MWLDIQERGIMRRRPLRSLVVLLVAAVAALAAQVGALADAASNGPPTAIGTGGAAATVDVLATQAAVDTLRNGGNAVDAAVAAAAVLGVTEPFSCGIGGGGFMVLYRASDGKVTTIDGRETAPAAMRPDSFWENGAPLPFNDARFSGLSVGVPGTVETWDEALERYGTISLADALAAGIRVARDGFVVDQTFFDQTQTTSTSSTTSRRLPRSTSIRTARRTTSAPSSAIPTSRARTSGSRTSGRRASTAVRSRTRSSTRCSTRSCHRPPTTPGGPGS